VSEIMELDLYMKEEHNLEEDDKVVITNAK